MNCKDEFDRLNGIASITKGAQSLVDGIERVLRENLDKDKAIAELSRRLTNLEVENKELRLEIGRIDKEHGDRLDKASEAFGELRKKVNGKE